MLVGVLENGAKDAVGALTVGEAGHGIGAPSHLAELAFDDIGRAELLPVRAGLREKGHKGVQVFTQTDHRFGRQGFPLRFPGAKAREGLPAAGGLVDTGGFFGAFFPLAGKALATLRSLCAQQRCSGTRGKTNCSALMRPGLHWCGQLHLFSLQAARKGPEAKPPAPPPLRFCR